MRILLIEDDHQLGDGIVSGLAEEGHSVAWSVEGRHGDRALRDGDHEVVILDLTLPDVGGDQLLAQWRDDGLEVPVLILTARDTLADRVAGLDAGADDYIVKPFEFDELCARIRALRRRDRARAESLIRHGALTLDPLRRRVVWQNKPLHLPEREYALLQLLLEQHGAVVTRQRIQAHLYSYGKEVNSNTVEVYVHNLRRLFGAKLIRTIRGVGYVVEGEADEGAGSLSESELCGSPPSDPA